MAVKSIRARLADDPEIGAGNVLTLLASRGERAGEPVVTFDTDVDGHPAWQPFTVAELDQAVAARAAALHALGVGRRDPVAVCSPASAGTALLFLALTRLGAIPALVNPNLPPDLLAAYLGKLRAVGVITDAAHAAQLAEQGSDTPVLADLDALAGDPAQAPPPYAHFPTDPVAITHSSGTTGIPKAVVHSHESLFAAIRYRLRLPRPQGAERMLSAMPCAHAAGVIALNLGMCNGGEVAMLSSQHGEQVLAAIERWRPGCVIGFSSTWPDMAKLDLASRDLSSVALWWNTGDCAHEAHIRRLVACGSRQVATSRGRERVPGSVFVDGLGSSEMGHSHFHIAHTPETNRYGRCIGKPHSFAEAGVFGPDGELLPPGEIGELGTKAPTLSLGYWNDSALTYRTRHRGYFLTGDLVYRDEEGYFYHLDRKADTVRLPGGRYLHTAASEERILAACPDVLDCAIVAGQDGGEVVTDVLLQLERGADRAADRRPQVLGALEPQVAGTVRDVVVIDEDAIPLTATGKVRKFVLRQRHLQGAAR